MGRKKKKIDNTFEEQMYAIAKDLNSGIYGSGINAKHGINALGYGNIYPTVKKYAKLLLTGQLL